MRDRCDNCGMWRSEHYDKSGAFIAACPGFVGIDDPDGEKDPGEVKLLTDRRVKCANCGRARAAHYDAAGAWDQLQSCPEYVGVEP